MSKATTRTSVKDIVWEDVRDLQVLLPVAFLIFIFHGVWIPPKKKKRKKKKKSDTCNKRVETDDPAGTLVACLLTQNERLSSVSPFLRGFIGMPYNQGFFFFHKMLVSRACRKDGTL